MIKLLQMKLKFDHVKATQAAAFMLRLAGSPLKYVALIKLLYKTDRKAIRELGIPITTDEYVSMKHGPVTSKIYDLIKSSASGKHPTYWSKHIQRIPNQHFVVLECDPGTSELSIAEERIISEIFKTDGSKDRFELVDETHLEFPEWTDPGNSSAPIEIEDIIAALGLSEDEASHVEAMISLQQSAMSLAE